MNTEEILYICTSCGIKENIPKEVVEYFDEMGVKQYYNEEVLDVDFNTKNIHTQTKSGMNNIYSYQRLESPKKANPSLLTLNKIKKIFPELNLDMIFT